LSKTSVEERRAHERRAANITVHGTPDQDGVVARMVTRNLSLGGLYCTSTTDFPEMTRLEVRLVVPPAGAAAESIDLEAVVVRREKSTATNGDPRFDLALFFTNVDDTARTQLQRIIDHC
jgi:c-di-GMP-binding flagellar brake protein YcgR